MIKRRKVVIVGDGAVGSTCAFVLAIGHVVNDIVIIDVNKDKVEGDVMDIKDGMSLVSVPKDIKAGDYTECKDAQIIIITAGAAQKPGETRIDLLKKNAAITKSICDSIKPYLDPKTLVMVVSNPCDILTYIVQKELGLPYSQVFGSGTVLDTSRLKNVISEELNVDPRNVHTYIVGEHGDSELPVWSLTTVGGISLLDYCNDENSKQVCNLNLLYEKVRNAAYEIISKKGATNYAVALAVARIVSAVLNDENSILTVSTYLKDEFNGMLTDVYLSVPCVINLNGVKQILRPNYTRAEKMGLISSGQELIAKRLEVYK